MVTTPIVPLEEGQAKNLPLSFFTNFQRKSCFLYLWILRWHGWQCAMLCFATLIHLSYRQQAAVCGLRMQHLLMHTLPHHGAKRFASRTQIPLWDTVPSRSVPCAPPHCPIASTFTSDPTRTVSRSQANAFQAISLAHSDHQTWLCDSVHSA